MKTNLILTILTLWSVISPCVSQSGGENELALPELSLEEIVASTDDENQAALILEELIRLADHPLDINHARAEELAGLYYLNDFQIFSLLEYRKKYGDLLSLTELDLIPGFREDLIGHILPYIRIRDPSLNPVSSGYNNWHFRHKLMLRSVLSLPLKKGFTEQCDSLLKFRGSPLSRMINYELSSGKDIGCGFTLENDPGESFEWSNQRKGFDFTSAFIEVSNKGIFDKIVLGDFRYGTGCGLVNGSGRKSKSTDVILTPKEIGVRRYTSAAEYGFNRGLAFHAGRNKLTGCFMVSSRKINVNREMEADSSRFFSSFNTSGLFRNAKEDQGRERIRENKTGAHLSYATGKFSAGYAIQVQTYTIPYRYRIRTDQYSPVTETDHLMNHSIDYMWRKGNCFVRGEIALDTHARPAFTATMTGWLHPLLTVCMNYRYYHPEYISLSGSAFAESGTVRNEQGFYFGLDSYPFRFLKLSGYIDIYRFPWLKYRGLAPQKGRDFLLQGVCTVNQRFEVTGLFKFESQGKQRKADSPGIGITTCQKDLRWMGQVIFRMNDQLQIKSRIECRRSHIEGEKRSNGFLMYQGISYRCLKNRLLLHARYALFDSPDFSTRIYAYENDLLYRFSIPCFYHTGSRSYLSGRIKISSLADLWFRYALTWYTYPVVSGNGADQREGNSYGEAGLELILKF